jgi:hypothetical protein
VLERQVLGYDEVTRMLGEKLLLLNPDISFQSLVWCGMFPGYAHGAPHRSVTSQLLSAGLTQFSKEIEPAPTHIVQHLVHGAIRPKVGLNDRVECPLGSREDCRGRYQPYSSQQSKELDQVRGIILLVIQRIRHAQDFLGSPRVKPVG